MTVQGLAVLELDEHRVALRRREETQGKLDTGMSKKVTMMMLLFCCFSPVHLPWFFFSQSCPANVVVKTLV